MKRLVLVLALICPSMAFAQGGSLGSVSSPLVNSQGQPIAGAFVSICQPLATTAAQVTSNLAVLTMASNPIAAGFAAGGTILVSGFSGADAYFNGGTFTNGTGITNGYTILSVTSTTIMFALTHANATATSNGTVLQMGNATTSCGGLATVYSDPANTSVITQPVVTDGYGNWQAFTPATGLYYVQFYGPAITTSFRQMTAVSPSNMPNVNGVISLASGPACASAVFLYPCTDAGIQAAINAAPAGGTVFMPAGTYVLGPNLPITITKSINLIGAGWGTALQVASSVGNTIDAIVIAPSGQIRGGRLQDFTLTSQSGTPGRYGINITTSPNNNFALFVFEHLNIGPLGAQTIYLNNTGGEANGGTFDATIQDCWLQGGILGSAVGDSLNIVRNLISGSSFIGVDVSFTPGSSTLRIMNNTIDPPAAAIHIGASALFTQIEGNEFETPSSGTTGSNGAYVDLDGTMAAPINFAQIRNNSFQIVNSSTLNALRLNYANGTNIGGKGVENNFELPTSPGVNIITTANAAGTKINHNIWEGSPTWARILSDGASAGQTLNTDDTQALPTTEFLYQDNNATVHLHGGTGTGDAFQLVNGCNYIFDGTGATNIAGAFCGSLPVVTTSSYAKFQNIVNQNLLFAGTAPTISSGFGTSPSIVQQNGTAAFEVNVGTGGSATSGVIGLPTAANGWSCQATDMNTNIVTRETAFTTTTVTLTAASAWAASDKLLINCGAF